MITNITPILEQFTQNAAAFLPKLVSAVLVLIIGFRTQSISDKWLTTFFDKHDYDESLEKFVQSLIAVSYKILVILIAVSIAGIETASIITIFGAAGFAVGLALQGSMSNFASGILILTLKPIKVNDFIEIKDYTGTVNRIEIFNTTLLTVDNKTVIIPNSDITSNVLINYSKQNLRRVDLSIGVGYDSDIKKVKEIIYNTVKKQDHLVIENENKKIFIRVSELADSAIIFSIRSWCKRTDYLELKHTLLEEIKEALDKAKIDIPFQTFTIKK